jgi:catechol 2,3-dioxygenase-like lactoylglutathione lyase family enzyme
MVQVRHVLTILAVRDLQRAVELYRSFGWEQVVEEAVYAEYLLPGGMRLGLYQRTGFGKNIGMEPIEIPPGGAGPAELYLHSDDPLDTIERLKRAGARELSALARRDWGDEAAYLADLDGHVIAVARPLR